MNESHTHPEFESSPDAYRVKLQAFEGPLDLLVHLIRKNEVNIYDIPISLVTEQYLGYIGLMQELNLDIAGEFLVMAATLIHIKSRMLLPRPEQALEDGAEEDPREALVRRLLEHQKYKAAAELLHDRETLRSAQFTRADASVSAAAGDAYEPELEVDLFGLLAAFKGTDGIKTGYTQLSGFNLVTSVVRDNKHVVGVVMGGTTAASRDREMMRILSATFDYAASDPTVLADANMPWQGGQGPAGAPFGATLPDDNVLAGLIDPPGKQGRATAVAIANAAPAAPARNARPAMPTPRPNEQIAEIGRAHV